MATANQFLIGANDEHGMNPPTAGKRTPTMPYIGRSFYENEVNRQMKLRFLASCARCNFNTYDVHPEIEDTSVSTRVRRANNARVNALITFAYNAYGTGLSFNNVDGYIVFYSNANRFSGQSKLLALDVSEGVATEQTRDNLGISTLSGVGVLQSVNCPSVLLEGGFMTNFNEAKLMLNPIFCEQMAEGAAKGVCEYFEVPFVEISTPKRTLRRGNVSNLVKYAQYLLILGGYNLTADGIFGINTQLAVRSFQQDVDITIDGIIGTNTWNYLTRSLNRYPTLRKSSRGAYVNLLQRLLTSYLYPLGEIDGIFGANTERAVKQFQSENALDDDGIVGVRTWNALLSSKGRPYPSAT